MREAKPDTFSSSSALDFVCDFALGKNSAFAEKMAITVEITRRFIRGNFLFNLNIYLHNRSLEIDAPIRKRST